MKYFMLFSLMLVAGIGFTQEQKKKNLQYYSPSILIGKGSWELKNFNNVYTQTKSFDGNGGKVDLGKRDTYYTMINQFLYGISDKLNIGMDLWYKQVNSEGRFRNGVTGVGPKIKLTPLKSVPYFSWQSTFLFPLAEDMESRAPDASEPGLFLEFDRYLWINQLFYDRQLNDNFQIFLQAAFWYSITRDSFREKNFLETPLSVFLSYFPTRRLTFYVMTEYWAKHHEKAFNAFFVQSGLGTKYQIVEGVLELELLYTNFWLGSQDEGAGQTFNLGIRLIR